MVEEIATPCTEWSLNKDKETSKLFWWNSIYTISVWDSTLGIKKAHSKLSDTDVWRAFMQFQLDSVFKLCPVCRRPEGCEDMKICCYCGQTVHCVCSSEATSKQLECKEANKYFLPHLRVCHTCLEVPLEQSTLPVTRERCTARRAAQRALAIRDEYPEHLVSELDSILRKATKTNSRREDESLVSTLRQLLTCFFQPKGSSSLLTKVPRESKGGGVGVVSASTIPAFTVIGVYPGYLDPMSGEQTKLGRPVAKYALMDLNCADYFNVVFEELQGTFTPYINEPNEDETSNCAWIQETKHKEGRLSVMTTREIKEGEELLIGYGPLYPRTYTFAYDVLTFHRVESDTEAICFALWHWPSTKESDARIDCHIRYDSTDDRYYLWDSEDAR
ncbi:SET domain [Trypanosoma vivax]|uniref:SET domain-containing protein n=1 Tax=Trypanosoma vivax (strain Y486) TaxID=1055687 RepID=G0TT07_TRYVY|nr:hypothetical protein TRVL_04864 [Trypanosoma vivax]KAH8605783.1 SET domain [Trypanosoma vivax]CCC47088.1 conserved hypothetical protein [Trypanosoma vivax Y486]